MNALKVPSIIFCLCVLMLAGCVRSAAVVTGVKRTPLDPSQVQLFTHAPSHYEVIGIVAASSAAGLTEQGSLDYVLQDLKIQASELGANGIRLILTEKNTLWVPVMAGDFPYMHPSTRITVYADAIYVCDDPNLNDICKEIYTRESIKYELGVLVYAEYVLSRGGDMAATYRLLEEGITSEHSEVRERFRLFIAQNPEILDGARSTFTPESFKESITKNDKNTKEIENRRLLIYKTVAPADDYLKARHTFESVFGFAE